ncbi:acyl-CoA carboxylase epsilon subunit [Streptomyces sp. BB1-1-1]|uniref:acyl-CoA carboxylase epsilon subunit n=1 Tax=Streptomyces sp. BB1-1-1 TaxID=3074430 RepID=UPI002877D5BA|nr:acyl-CoA carboxylase epsilon subunit [Streptomyces sp. BB1-1-1]WND34675.1 acyl-CoA carboxylase epsilon subunit [Streptomyces sp. BB1-1-1]
MPPPSTDHAGTAGDDAPAGGLRSTTRNTGTTGTTGTPQPLLRIEKGNPDEAELAALTAVLLARAGVLPGRDEEAKQADRRTACWRRLERRTRPGTPRSWRDTAPRR